MPVTMKTTYNHAYAVAFSVSGSNFEDPYDAMEHEKPKVIKDLLKRVGDLVENQGQYMEALEGFDTYEEDGVPREADDS